jgi:hypothetical protein
MRTNSEAPSSAQTPHVECGVLLRLRTDDDPVPPPTAPKPAPGPDPTPTVAPTACRRLRAPELGAGARYDRTRARFYVAPGMRVLLSADDGPPTPARVLGPAAAPGVWCLATGGDHDDGQLRTGAIASSEVRADSSLRAHFVPALPGGSSDINLCVPWGDSRR